MPQYPRDEPRRQVPVLYHYHFIVREHLMFPVRVVRLRKIKLGQRLATSAAFQGDFPSGVINFGIAPATALPASLA